MTHFVSNKSKILRRHIELYGNALNYSKLTFDQELNALHLCIRARKRDSDVYFPVLIDQSLYSLLGNLDTLQIQSNESWPKVTLTDVNTISFSAFQVRKCVIFE